VCQLFPVSGFFAFFSRKIDCVSPGRFLSVLILCLTHGVDECRKWALVLWQIGLRWAWSKCYFPPSGFLAGFHGLRGFVGASFFKCWTRPESFDNSKQQQFLGRMNMKKLLAVLSLVAVSCALVGTPAQAAETKSPTMTLAKNKHHHKKQHKKHKKHAKA
jgi:hypothetical protein